MYCIRKRTIILRWKVSPIYQELQRMVDNLYRVVLIQTMKHNISLLQSFYNLFYQTWHLNKLVIPLNFLHCILNSIINILNHHHRYYCQRHLMRCQRILHFVLQIMLSFGILRISLINTYTRIRRFWSLFRLPGLSEIQCTLKEYLK